MVKVLFRGPELFKKKGASFQKRFYLPSFFRPSSTNWLCDFKWMVLIRLYFLRFLPIKLHVAIAMNVHSQPVCQTAVNQSRTLLSLCCSMRLAETYACFLARDLIGRSALVHLQLWRHDRDVNHQTWRCYRYFSRATCDDCRRKLYITSKRSVNVMKSMSVERGRSKDASQVGFFTGGVACWSFWVWRAELYIENDEVNGYLFSTNMGFQKSIFSW